MPEPTDDLTAPDRLAQSLRQFASEQRRRSPLSSALVVAAADDADILGLLGQAPERQRRAVLLLAALHDLVLLRPDAPLSQCYPTVTGGPAEPQRAAGLLAAACREWHAELLDSLTSRATQTNEVGRAAAFVPAWSEVGRDGVPLALIELGASAGLLLCADRFRVEFTDGAGFGPTDAALVVRAEARGTWPDPASLGRPTIVHRTGVDLDPVDLRDDARSRWLLACVWGDDLERFRRLQRAIALVHDDPPDVVTGDLIDQLPHLLDAVPPGVRPVVMNSWALAYLSAHGRHRVAELLDSVGRARDLDWLSFEAIDETPELPRPAEPLHTTGATDLVHVAYRAGRRTVRRLAEAHPHGRWVEWLAPDPVVSG